SCGSCCSAVLELTPPAGEDAVHARCAQDGGRRSLQRGRVQDESARLEAADASVKRDQFLEGAPLVQVRVVKASDHDVGDVLEAVRAQQVLGRMGGEGRQWILALHTALREVVNALGAER